MQQMLGEMVHHPDSGQHNITLRSRKRSDDPEVSSLMSFDASIGEHIGNIDIVPLGLFGRDIQP